MGTLQKRESFPLRTSSVNVTKSLIENFIFCAVECVFHFFFFFFFLGIFIMVEEYEKLDQERKVVRKKKHFSINYNYKTP